MQPDTCNPTQSLCPEASREATDPRRSYVLDARKAAATKQETSQTIDKTETACHGCVQPPVVEAEGDADTIVHPLAAPASLQCPKPQVLTVAAAAFHHGFQVEVLGMGEDSGEDRGGGG